MNQWNTCINLSSTVYSLQVYNIQYARGQTCQCANVPILLKTQNSGCYVDLAAQFSCLRRTRELQDRLSVLIGMESGQVDRLSNFTLLLPENNKLQSSIQVLNQNSTTGIVTQMHVTIPQWYNGRKIANGEQNVCRSIGFFSRSLCSTIVCRATLQARSIFS